LYPKTRPREHHRRDEIATSVIEFSAFHVRRTVAIEAGPSPQPIPRWNTDLDRGEGQPVTTGHDVIGRLCPLHPPARVEHVAQRVVALPGALPQQSQVRSRTPLVIRHVAEAFDEPLRSQVEVRNQARVHLWFKDRFGEDYAPLSNTDEALGRFVAPAFAVGVRLDPDDTISIAAPFGLDDVFDRVIRQNPDRSLAKGWDRAIAGVLTRWPAVRVIAPA